MLIVILYMFFFSLYFCNIIHAYSIAARSRLKKKYNFIIMKNKKAITRILTLIVFLCISAFSIRAGEEAINIHHVGHHGTHSQYYPPADMPEAYFDSNDMQIILVGDGFADYYDVEVVSLGSMLTVISTQVDGFGDSIDVSSLPDGDYRIVITSSNNNVYEGDFAIE